MYLKSSNRGLLGIAWQPFAAYFADCRGACQGVNVVPVGDGRWAVGSGCGSTKEQKKG